MISCAAPRHDSDDDPPPVESHAALCRPCRTGLRRDLRRLPALDTALQQLAILRNNGHGDGTGLPFSEPATDCRHQIRHDLDWWCRHITTQRDFDHTRMAVHPAWAENPVLVMAAWLVTQVEWLVLFDWAPDMAGAIAADAARASALADPWLTKRFAISGEHGQCPDCAPGRLNIIIYASEGDRRRSQVWCDECERIWTPEMWMRLGQRLVRNTMVTSGLDRSSHA